MASFWHHSGFYMPAVGKFVKPNGQLRHISRSYTPAVGKFLCLMTSLCITVGPMHLWWASLLSPNASHSIILGPMYTPAVDKFVEPNG